MKDEKGVLHPITEPPEPFKEGKWKGLKGWVFHGVLDHMEGEDVTREDLEEKDPGALLKYDDMTNRIYFRLNNQRKVRSSPLAGFIDSGFQAHLFKIRLVLPPITEKEGEGREGDI